MSGRKALINPARMANLLANIKNGAYFKHAAAASGISYVTAYAWDRRGSQALATMRLTPGHEDVDDVLADWLMVYPDYEEKDPIWDAEPPSGLEGDDWSYILFSVLLEKAQGSVRHGLSAGDQVGRAQQWQAHMTWLERTHPDEYGKQKVVTHQGPDGGPVEIAVASQEELVEKLLKLKEAKSHE